MVYILIPAHNNRKEVLGLLGCLSRQTYKDARVVFVDDGSTDGTEGEVRRLFPETVILKGDGNLWWTGANVMGVDYIMERAAEGDFILLLNNDLVVEDGYVSELVSGSVGNGRALVGSTLVDYDNRDYIESGVRLDDRLNLIINRDKIESSDYDYAVDVLPGRGTLVPVEVFRKIGNFNLRKLPHYGADYEFSVRAKRAGFSLIVSHRARVYAKLNITGYRREPENKIISLRQCWKLLFSKKSTSNIFYYLNYVWLCSEREHRTRNFIRSAIIILYTTVGSTVPLVILRYAVIAILWVTAFIPFFLLKGRPPRLSDIRLALNHKE